MDENTEDTVRIEEETDDPSWLTLGFLLADRRLFESLFSIFRTDADSDESKEAAMALLESAAKARGLNYQTYMELLTDFAYWFRDLSVLAHLQRK